VFTQKDLSRAPPGRGGFEAGTLLYQHLLTMRRSKRRLCGMKNSGVGVENLQGGDLTLSQLKTSTAHGDMEAPF